MKKNIMKKNISNSLSQHFVSTIRESLACSYSVIENFLESFVQDGWATDPDAPD
jgi:hypothetical protein